MGGSLQPTEARAAEGTICLSTDAMKTPLIIAADDLQTGMFVSVHNGARINCPGCGGGGEMYGKFKGLPLAVIGISLPYVACAVLPVGAPAL